MPFLPTTLLVGTAALLFTATTVKTSPLPPHNNDGPLVPFCFGPLGIPLICPPSVPEIHLTPGIVIPDGANNGIEHGGEVSENEKGPVPEVAKEKIEPRSDENHGIEQHDGDQVFEVHRTPVVFPDRANDGKERFAIIVTHDGANGGKESFIVPGSYNGGKEHGGEASEKGHQVAPKEKIEPRSEENHGIEQHGGKEDETITLVLPSSYNDGIEHGNDEVQVPASYNDGLEHGGKISEQKIEPRNASPDFGAPRYVSVAEDHWGKWQGNDAWFATPMVPKDKKVGP